MERRTVILKNCIRCKTCGDILDSKSRHDWICCRCFKESNGMTGVFNDGGLDYMRRGGDINGYEDLSETRQMNDAEVAEYNAKEKELAEKYDFYKPKYME